MITIWFTAFKGFNSAVEKGRKTIKTRKIKHFNDESFLSGVSGMCWELMLTEADDINFFSTIGLKCFLSSKINMPL